MDVLGLPGLPPCFLDSVAEHNFCRGILLLTGHSQAGLEPMEPAQFMNACFSQFLGLPRKFRKQSWKNHRRSASQTQSIRHFAVKSCAMLPRTNGQRTVALFGGFLSHMGYPTSYHPLLDGIFHESTIHFRVLPLVLMWLVVWNIFSFSLIRGNVIIPTKSCFSG